MLRRETGVGASIRTRSWISLALVVLLLGVAATSLKRSQATPLPKCLQRLDSKRCYGPSQVRLAYEVDPLLQRGITGKGRTIAIVVSFGSPTIRSDLHAFDQAFSLPDPQLDIRAPLGTRQPLHSGWQGETTLDVEWAHVMAPGARIVLLTSPVDETEGVHGLPEFLALERYAVQHHLADVISQSWAATEDTLFDKPGRALVAQFHQFYGAATKEGVTIVGASGDDGAAGLDLSAKHLLPYRVVQYPASDPFVLAVGGTRLVLNSRGRNETAWQGSGGGFSKLFSEPSYQHGLPAPTQRLLHGRRGLPDVALNAASPILIYWRGRWRLAGGTSASAPQWAGLIALADSAAGHDLGTIQAALYRLAGSPRYHADLNDITSGSIKDPPGSESKQTPLRAAPGWDAATGLGSPRAASLLPDLIRLND
jgi:subtilase family serine protease